MHTKYQSMKKSHLVPDAVFEISWEVCNKVGGIYTVLSTHAQALQKCVNEKLIFIGPDITRGEANPLFLEDKRLWHEWKATAGQEGLHVRVGRWNIPGKPYVILVDFSSLFSRKNEIYAWAWEHFKVDSLHAYGDYDESSMFSWASAMVAESFYRHYYAGKGKRVIYHAHEWMACLGALYIRANMPEMATVFTTHATSIGRSIAGNGKPLYEYLWAYNGFQMAEELNMQSKHSVERQAAHNVDCFTTVSDVTARECEELLDKRPDAVLMNGFELDFVPKGHDFTIHRSKARKRIFDVANALTGVDYPDDTLIVSTSGRYEFRNKGIDLFLESMIRMLYHSRPARQILALVQVPGWVACHRQDLADRLAVGGSYDTPLSDPVITHWLHNAGEDRVLTRLHDAGIQNRAGDRIHIIFVPCYLDGQDGIFQTSYYDLLIGEDIAAYPSYYEPWGYTPLEAAAFHIPCVTTSLSGFGGWASSLQPPVCRLEDGVEVIRRTDYNADEVIDCLSDVVLRCSEMSAEDMMKCRKKASRLAAKAQWKYFISYYMKAYEIALAKSVTR